MAYILNRYVSSTLKYDKYDKISRMASAACVNLMCYADNTLMLTDEM